MMTKEKPKSRAPRRKKEPDMKGWASWIAVGFTMAVSLVQLAYVTGVLQGRISTVEATLVRHETGQKLLEALPTRIQFAEEALRRLESNISAMGTVMADVAVIKSEMRQLNDNVKLLQSTFAATQRK